MNIGEIMPTNEELHAADKKHEAAIEELRAGLKEQRELISRHDQHIKRLDDFMDELRETLATKDDIAGLRADLREREVLHERLDHYRERLQEMEAGDMDQRNEKKHAESMRVNWMMVAMFVGELALAAATFWLMVRHG